MTFAEMLNYIGQHAKYPVMDGDAAQTLEKARAGTHQNPIAGRIIAELYTQSGVSGLDSEIVRAAAVNALGPLRLVYMKDDAPVEGFRTIEDVVYRIDGAFNEEAFRLKSQGKDY